MKKHLLTSLMLGLFLLTAHAQAASKKPDAAKLPQEVMDLSQEYLKLQSKEEVSKEDLARVFEILDRFGELEKWALGIMLDPPKDLDATTWEAAVRVGVATGAMRDHFNLTVYVATEVGKNAREKVEKELGMKIEDHWTKVVQMGLMALEY